MTKFKNIRQDEIITLARLVFFQTNKTNVIDVYITHLSLFDKGVNIILIFHHNYRMYKSVLKKTIKDYEGIFLASTIESYNT